MHLYSRIEGAVVFGYCVHLFGYNSVFAVKNCTFSALWQIVDERETGRSRGFGFVVFDDEKSMENAIQGMNGQQIGGRTISVSRANQRSSRWR